MAAGRRGTVYASMLVIACAWQVGGCGESSSRGSGGAGASSSGAPTAGSGGTKSDGGSASTGAAAGSGGRASVAGMGATSGSGEAGRGIPGGTASGGATNGGVTNGGTTGGGAAGEGSNQGGSSGTGLPEAGTGGAIAGGAGIAGDGGTAGMPEFSCPELGLCYIDCTIADHCLRRCALEASTFGTNEAVEQVAALKCEMLDSPFIVYGDVTSVEGLETIRIARSQVSVDIPEIDDVSGLSGLERVEGKLVIASVAATEIEFPVLEEVGASLYVVGLGSVQRIRLPKLTTVGEDCDINSTFATEIDLDALERVGTNLRISSNPKLTTLNELPSLVEAQSLEIAKNDELPQCEVDAIAARLGLECDLCAENSEVCP